MFAKNEEGASTAGSASSRASTVWLAAGVVAASLGGALLLQPQGAEAAKKKNGIIFDIQTSQGINGRITYLKNYEGEGKNFAQLEIEVIRNCVGDFTGPERGFVILKGHTEGNGFFFFSHPQNTATDQFQQSASGTFRPQGRRGGLPKWRNASGNVRSFRSIHDPFLNVDCDSGPVSFVTTSSRRARFGPRPPIIVVI